MKFLTFLIATFAAAQTISISNLTLTCTKTNSGLSCQASALVNTQPSDPLYVKPALAAPNGPSNIWLTDSLAKVPKLTTLPGGAAGSTRALTIMATKNEIQSFQVHVKGPVAALSVRVSDFTGSGGKIDASTTDVVIYREEYMNVTIPTARAITYVGYTGPIPDILIPAVDPYFHQKTTAFPVAVPSGENRSAWVDVHVPATLSSGWYTASVTVSDGNTLLATLPVQLGVWNWTMPSTSTLKSATSISYAGFCRQAYGSPGTGNQGCEKYPGALNAADFGVTLANRDAAVLMLDHRFSLSGITNIYPGAGAFSNADGSPSFDSVYGPLLDGSAPTILKGAKLTSWQFTPLMPLQMNAATFQNFTDHWKAKGWPLLYYGLRDEPSTTDPAVWTQLIADGTAAHGFSTPIIPNEVTIDLPTLQKFSATNVVDLLVTNLTSLDHGPMWPLQDLSQYRAWVAASPSRAWWAYQACNDAGTCNNGAVGPQFTGEPATFPNYNVDGLPVANRLMEWLTFLHGQTGELYYYVDICDGPGGAANDCGLPNVGANMDPLTTNYYSGGWGDGTLIYVGKSSYTGTATPIWLPSIRLKHIRDGMQDYEYLNALKAAGQGSLAMQQVNALITNSYTFSVDPVAFQAARAALGTALHKLGQ